MLGGPRIIYGMANAGSLPGVLASVHPRFRTPWIAILGIGCVSSLFVLLGNITTIANIANFMIFIVFFMVNTSLIELRYTEPERRRPFRVPFSIGRLPLFPSLGALSAVFLFSQISAEIMIYGFFLTIIGFIIVLFRTQKSPLRLRRFNFLVIFVLTAVFLLLILY